MRASSILSVAFIGLASAALPKANEYRSGDCSGSINYGHHSASLGDVTMDDTSHSVYITGRFVAYAGKSGDGGRCTGEAIALLSQGCNNLDTFRSGRRVRCVRLNKLP